MDAPGAKTECTGRRTCLSEESLFFLRKEKKLRSLVVTGPDNTTHMSEEASAEAAVPAALEAADGSLPSGSAGEVPPAGGSVEASPPPDGGRGLGGRPWQRDGEGSYSFPNGVAASALRAPARFLTAELDGVGTVYTGSFVDGMFHGRYANTEPLMTFHEAFLSIPCAKAVGISARTGAVDETHAPLCLVPDPKGEH